MKKIGTAAITIALVALPHDIITTKLTYTREVSRILAHRCLACHAAQSTIPLLSYAQVRPWAVAIKEQVLTRQMPPWGAVKGFGDFSPDHGLTQQETMIIAAWVVGGAPEGNPAYLPNRQPAPPLNAPPLQDALVIANRSVLKKPLLLAGIRPIATGVIDSARITATFPDGHIEPLLWLFRYQPEAQASFRLRRPLALPVGTTIEADSPAKFALLVAQTLKSAVSTLLSRTTGGTKLPLGVPCFCYPDALAASPHLKYSSPPPCKRSYSPHPAAETATKLYICQAEEKSRRTEP